MYLVFVINYVEMVKEVVLNNVMMEMMNNMMDVIIVILNQVGNVMV